MNYQENETTRLIGLQSCKEITRPQFHKQGKDILEAYGYGENGIMYGRIKEVAMDFYMIGIIRGKQIERTRRKENSKSPSSKDK